MASTAPGVPVGYHTVCPYLVVPRAEPVLEFMQQAFGGKVREMHRTPEGHVMHAEVEIGDSVLMLGQGNEEWGGFKAMIHLYMPDVDEVFRRAVEAGGRPVREVSTQDYGDRTGGVEDPAGNQWWIATRVGDRPSGSE